MAGPIQRRPSLSFGGVVKTGLRATLSLAKGSATIVDHVAFRMYERTGGSRTPWESISTGDRMLWQERARTAISALQEVIDLL